MWVSRGSGRPTRRFYLPKTEKWDMIHEEGVALCEPTGPSTSMLVVEGPPTIPTHPTIAFSFLLIIINISLLFFSLIPLILFHLFASLLSNNNIPLKINWFYQILFISSRTQINLKQNLQILIELESRNKSKNKNIWVLRQGIYSR